MGMYNFNKGATIFDQIYREGEPTWGCKSGVVDVEDVKKLLLDVRNLSFNYFSDELAWESFIDKLNNICGIDFWP